MTTKLPCHAVSFSYTARDTPELEAILSFETENELIGMGTMSWILQARTLNTNQKKTTFSAMARRRSKDEVHDLTHLTVQVHDDGVFVIDKDGS